ncbi:MAG TPA: ABC transporter ATP-binding protein [Hansschlegelia sp.]
MEKAMLLEVRDLSKRFGGVRAVDRVTWSIAAGETRCIIGPNGAGKSTFFQTLVGRIRPDSGEIRFAGRDVTRLHSFQRARLGVAVKPQTLGVFPDLEVEHNLRLCLQRSLRGAALEDALTEKLAELDLLAKRRYPTRALSHGEKQWLGLGMALASSPQLLLLDEPTAGMSPVETEKTVEIIKAAAAAGVSVLVIEHDMAFVRSLSVETTVFDAGRVFANGDISEIEKNEDVQRLYLGQRGAERLRN